MSVWAEFSDNRIGISQCLLDNWDDVSEDGIDPENWELPKDANYVALMHDSDIMGYQLYNQLNSITHEIHTVIKREYRSKVMSFMSQRHGWGLMFDETDCHKIVAEIPEFREDVIKYAKLLGMKIEGKNSKSWLKYGNIWDQIRLGISKDEFRKEGRWSPNRQNG